MLAIGRIKFDAVILALFAAAIADLVCTAWGAPHTQYRIGYLEEVVLWQQHIGFNLWLTSKVMLAVFATATSTPLACTIMGVELFGGEYLVYLAIACFLAYAFSGHTGIYGSERIAADRRAEARTGAPMNAAND